MAVTRWRDGAVAEVEVPGGGASEAGRAVVEVRGLRAGYGGRVVLEDVTFSVFPGQRVAVVGPNGAGKSTLFNCIAGLLRPTAGTILLA
ncbi:MAG: ATP-binding cassette domain-containing protein, partial [Bacillota bacterium]